MDQLRHQGRARHRHRRATSATGLPLETDSIDYIVSIHALPEIPYADLVPALARAAPRAEAGRRAAAGAAGPRQGHRRLPARATATTSRSRTRTRAASARKFVTQMIWYGWSRSLFTHDFIEELLERGRLRARSTAARTGRRRARSRRSSSSTTASARASSWRRSNSPTRSCSTGTSSGSPAATSRSGTTSTTCAPPSGTRRWCASPRSRRGTRPIPGTRAREHVLGGDDDVDFDVLFLSGVDWRGMIPTRRAGRVRRADHQPGPARLARLPERPARPPHASFPTRRSGSASAPRSTQGDRGAPGRVRGPGVHDSRTRSTSTRSPSMAGAPGARHRRAGRREQAARAGARAWLRAAAPATGRTSSSSTQRIPRGELVG